MIFNYYIKIKDWLKNVKIIFMFDYAKCNIVPLNINFDNM